VATEDDEPLFRAFGKAVREARNARDAGENP